MNALKWLIRRGRYILLILIVVGGGGAFYRFKTKMRPEKREALKRGDIIASIYGSGELKTDAAFDLKIGVSARVVSIFPSVGSKVKKGDALVDFDGSSDFRSPIDGTVTVINYKNGEAVFPQTPVLSIVRADKFYIEMTLDQKSLRYVKEGQPVRISFDGYRDLNIAGKVRSTLARVGLFYAIIDLDTIDPSFLPGMSADIAIMTETKKDVLLVPNSAIREGKIMVAAEGRPREVSVSLGLDDGKFSEVISKELKEGDMVILRDSAVLAGG